MWFLGKILISAIIIAFASWLAGQKTFLAGFIVALPVTSILTLLFSYLEYRDITKINELAVSILVSVPLSLLFFLPFALNRWLKMNFALSFGLGFLFLFVAFLIHHSLFKNSV